MKQYFIDKLTEVTNVIDSVSNEILNKLTELSATELIKKANRLKDLKEKKTELIKDCVKYCTVAEIMEIYDVKDNWNNKSGIIDKNSLEYSFRFHSEGVTTAEREYLITKFGYSLKDIKIK